MLQIEKRILSYLYKKSLPPDYIPGRKLFLFQSFIYKLFATRSTAAATLWWTFGSSGCGTRSPGFVLSTIASAAAINIGYVISFACALSAPGKYLGIQGYC